MKKRKVKNKLLHYIGLPLGGLVPFVFSGGGGGVVWIAEKKALQN